MKKMNKFFGVYEEGKRYSFEIVSRVLVDTLEFMIEKSNFKNQNEIAKLNKVSNAYVTKMKKDMIFVLNHFYKKMGVESWNNQKKIGNIFYKGFLILIKYKSSNFRQYLTFEKNQEIQRLSNLIIAKLEQDCSQYLVEIKERLLKENQISISTSTIYNYLTKYKKWSKKKILYHNPNRFRNNNFEERILFVQLISQAINNFGIQNIHFMDETGFKRNRRDDGWSLVGKRPTKSDKNRINPKWNMFCLINSSGIEEISLIDHTAKGVDHAEFMLRKVLPLIQKNNEKSVIVMDNHSIHKWCETWLTDYFSEFQSHIIYMPVYSPDLNPIEMVFGTLKQVLKNHRDTWGVSPRNSILQSIFDFNENNTIFNFIKHIFKIK
ncbi:integrase protein-related [Anaeramoeba flamelloides]|uniref:Integrase protein-related n=1 Tax=Anaeramoeba flamelloides TaxID=1746091 RepID=A0ABQ8Z0K2_9EUKA|nr:integrase protein-related [Anaeramoeba flamelloides]